MTVSDAIRALQEVLKNEGDLDIFDTDYFLLSGVDVETSVGQFDKSWNMPIGYKFAKIDSFK